jgi:hypothetical protein
MTREGKSQPEVSQQIKEDLQQGTWPPSSLRNHRKHLYIHWLRGQEGM